MTLEIEKKKFTVKYGRKQGVRGSILNGLKIYSVRSPSTKVLKNVLFFSRKKSVKFFVRKFVNMIKSSKLVVYVKNKKYINSRNIWIFQVAIQRNMEKGKWI